MRRLARLTPCAVALTVALSAAGAEAQSGQCQQPLLSGGSGNGTDYEVILEGTKKEDHREVTVTVRAGVNFMHCLNTKDFVAVEGADGEPFIFATEHVVSFNAVEL